MDVNIRYRRVLLRYGRIDSLGLPGWLYTEESPAQTAMDAFKEDGEEAFEDTWYWSSTVFPNGKTAFLQHFGSGFQLSDGLSCEFRVRAVRLIQLDS